MPVDIFIRARIWLVWSVWEHLGMGGMVEMAQGLV